MSDLINRIKTDIQNEKYEKYEKKKEPLDEIIAEKSKNRAKEICAELLTTKYTIKEFNESWVNVIFEYTVNDCGVLLIIDLSKEFNKLGLDGKFIIEGSNLIFRTSKYQEKKKSDMSAQVICNKCGAPNMASCRCRIYDTYLEPRHIVVPHNQWGP